MAEKPNLLVILDVVQVCDYICAPPLTATNKVTDHEDVYGISRSKRLAESTNVSSCCRLGSSRDILKELEV
ncbi:hypothetical protein T03_1338 [Trichinella britovi]|uniref:Uncharacterized protein n=1 Tax=Trichinella britovi TaxID=45882 RepID=A0A0V1CHX0_TRIBR|nr:hypothetical protein T03_1338 [Trichinella britovi]